MRVTDVLRLLCCWMSVGVKVKIPFIVKPKDYSEEDRIADMIRTNSGRPLKFIEEARVYHDLKTKFNLTNVQIAKKVGKTSMHVGNALLLLDAPKELQEYVDNSLIAASTVIEQLKKDDDGNVTLGKVNTAIENRTKELEEKGQSDKKPKVSGKHIAKVEEAAKPEEKEPKQEAGKIVESTVCTIDISDLQAVIDDMDTFEDTISKAACATLRNVIKLANKEINGVSFQTSMLNDLI